MARNSLTDISQVRPPSCTATRVSPIVACRPGRRPWNASSTPRLRQRHLQRQRLHLVAPGEGFDLRLLPGRSQHVLEAGHAGEDEDGVLEDNPERVLEEAPPFGVEHAIYGLGPEKLASEVAAGDDQRA